MQNWQLLYKINRTNLYSINDNKTLGVEVKSGSQYKGAGSDFFRSRFKNSKCVTLNEALVVQLLQMNTSSECWDWLYSLGV